MFTYEIVSPESVVAQGQARMLVLEAYEGQLGLLKDHAPIVAQLEPGVVRIYSDQTDRSEGYFIAGGIVSMMENRCAILADEVLPVAQVTRELAQARLKAAQDAQVLGEKSPRDQALAQLLLKVAQAMVACSGK
jgi:F-type H+-transporting ATPase subunit epsilon